MGFGETRKLGNSRTLDVGHNTADANHGFGDTDVMSKAYEYNSDVETLIAECALPLQSIEDSFAVDSSGFSTINYVRWFFGV